MALSKDEVDILAQRIDNSIKEWIENLDSEIHNDFESRTCESCTFKDTVFNKRDKKNTEVCKNPESLMYKQYHSEGAMSDFSCNKREPKK